MAHNFLKIAGITALSLGWSLGLAHAAASPPPPPPPPAGAVAGTGSPLQTKAKAGTTAFTTGWNFYQCTASFEYYDGTNWWGANTNTDGSTFAVPIGTGGLWTIQYYLQAGCSHGSYWIYCPNSGCTGWNQIYIYE
jgi:hypothetical protein